MKTYKIILKADGAVTQLPDSQKLFGALVTETAFQKGEECARKLAGAVLEGKTYLELSNVLPLGYVPVPHDYLLSRYEEKSPGRDLKAYRKRIKRYQYIREKDLQIVWETPEECRKLRSYVREDDEQQLRAFDMSTEYGIQALETKLYTVPVLGIFEMPGEKKVTEFCFYMRGEEDGAGDVLLETVEGLKRDRRALILGKRASQGLNRYRVIRIERVKLPCGAKNVYLNLGMLLPDRIDFERSYLRLFTSERRPFEMPGGWESEYRKSFISFIDKGSVIVLLEGTRRAGKCVPSPFFPERDVVFGNAFLYPVGRRREG